MKVLGIFTVYTHYLEELCGISGTQIRKDLSLCKIFGKKRGGYPVEQIYESLNLILRGNKHEKAILVGAGKLGTVLMSYPGFEFERIFLLGAFDIDAEKVQTIKDFPIMPLERLESFVLEENIKYGIITVPAEAAQGVLDKMVAAGITGILNFSPCRLRYPQDKVVVNNLNIAQEFERLICEVNVSESGIEVATSGCVDQSETVELVAKAVTRVVR